MADKFAIKVVCTQCGKDDFLALEEDKTKALLFDTPEEAMAYTQSLSKRKARTFRSPDPDPNPLYECPNHACRVISPMYSLQLNVVKYQS